MCWRCDGERHYHRLGAEAALVLRVPASAEALPGGGVHDFYPDATGEDGTVDEYPVRTGADLERRGSTAGRGKSHHARDVESLAVTLQLDACGTPPSQRQLPGEGPPPTRELFLAAPIYEGCLGLHVRGVRTRWGCRADSDDGRERQKDEHRNPQARIANSSKAERSQLRRPELGLTPQVCEPARHFLGGVGAGRDGPTDGEHPQRGQGAEQTQFVDGVGSVNMGATSPNAIAGIDRTAAQRIMRLRGPKRVPAVAGRARTSTAALHRQPASSA